MKADSFQGIAPRVAAHLLPENAAQVAHNCDLTQAKLAPWKEPLDMAATGLKAGFSSLYRFNNSHWFTWTTDVDVCRGPIPDDTNARTYFTGDGAPKVTDVSIATTGTPYPFASWLLGVPKPTETPTVSPEQYDAVAGAYVAGDVVGYSTSIYRCLASTSGSWDAAKWEKLQTSELEYRSYVWCNVDGYGAEGPPCNPTPPVLMGVGQKATLTWTNAAVLGDGYRPDGNFRRLYRTNSGSSGTTYQHTADIGAATLTYTDSVASADLGSAIPSEEWFPPPATLKGIIALPNGVMAGFVDNVLWLSEPYMPHAWPRSNRKILAHKIVAIGSFGVSIVAATEAHPYVFTGSDPATMSEERLEKGYACVSKRGFVDMGYACIYPSPLGLMVVGTGQVDLVTEKIIDPATWRNLFPETIRAWQYRGKYFAVHTGGGFIFDPATGALTTHDFTAQAGWHDETTGDMYLGQSNKVMKFNAGASAVSLTWKSKRFIGPRPVNIGRVKVTAEAYPVTFKLYAEGVLKATRTITSKQAVTLPKGYTADTFEYELSGTNTITHVSTAATMEEL